MNLWFSLAFGLIFASGLGLELVGVASKRRGDTITENWLWIRDHLPGPAAWCFRIGTAGVLVWVIGHLLGGWA